VQFRLRLHTPAGICILQDKGNHEIVIGFDEIEWFGVKRLNKIPTGDKGNGGIIFEIGIKMTPVVLGNFNGSVKPRYGNGKILRIKQPK
jgi:hypothetical protein